ncbi:hypothetical protein J5N97_022173 [Dioscorea zingiberensis]|uniref:RING-type domain-containing protein n=1 Tax=Dioscorea zingiberensis TaxID=325984 RepID=A0A9D5CA23_9LILI|nr:hypothetical protein J5N97_022173 [Dioscorea zingiberensis]
MNGGAKSSEAMDLDASCSICLEFVQDRGERSIAKLQCGHEFHLDCIGSAFNVKGAMQCPNCRKVEKGRWLYANGNRSPVDFDFEGLTVGDILGLSSSDLPFGIQWCPFRGFPQLASLFEEGELQPGSYHELMGNIGFGDHSSASSSTQVCPYLAMHGFPHSIHTAPSTADTVPDNGRFHRVATGLAGQSSTEMMNSHSYSAIEAQNHNWQQQPSLSFSISANVDQSASQLGLRLPRNDPGGQQGLGSFVHPRPFLHGSAARNANNMGTQLGPPVLGDTRAHTRGHGGHIYQQSVPFSAVRGSPFAPIRRIRPRGSAMTGATPSSAEPSAGFYGFSVSGSLNRSVQEGESIGRHFDRTHGWGRDSFTHLPWIPLEAESHWWSPFNPSNANPQPGATDSVTRNFFPQRPTSERATQGRQENNGYQRIPPPAMPPFM